MFSQWGMLELALALAPPLRSTSDVDLDPTPACYPPAMACRYTSAVQGYALDAQSPTYTLPLAQADNEQRQLIAIKYGTAHTAVRPPCLEASTCTPKPGNCLISNICYANNYAATAEGVSCQLCDASKSSTAWTPGGRPWGRPSA